VLREALPCSNRWRPGQIAHGLRPQQDSFISPARGYSLPLAGARQFHRKVDARCSAPRFRSCAAFMPRPSGQRSALAARLAFRRRPGRLRL